MSESRPVVETARRCHTCVDLPYVGGVNPDERSSPAVLGHKRACRLPWRSNIQTVVSLRSKRGNQFILDGYLIVSDNRRSSSDSSKLYAVIKYISLLYEN